MDPGQDEGPELDEDGRVKLLYTESPIERARREGIAKGKIGRGQSSRYLRSMENAARPKAKAVGEIEIEVAYRDHEVWIGERDKRWQWRCTICPKRKGIAHPDDPTYYQQSEALAVGAWLIHRGSDRHRASVAAHQLKRALRDLK